MKTLQQLAKRASESTNNKTASTLLKVGSRTSESSAAIYLVKYKSALIAEGVLTEEDFKRPGGTYGDAWDSALCIMQQSRDESLVEISFELDRQLSF